MQKNGKQITLNNLTCNCELDNLKLPMQYDIHLTMKQSKNKSNEKVKMNNNLTCLKGKVLEI